MELNGTHGQITSCRIRYLPQQQRTETLTQRSNLKPQQAKNTLINCMWYRSRLCKAGLCGNFPTFLPDQQARVASWLRTEEFLPGTSPLLYAQKEDFIDIFAPKRSSQTHIDLSPSSRFTTKTTSTSNYRHRENKYIDLLNTDLLYNYPGPRCPFSKYLLWNKPCLRFDKAPETVVFLSALRTSLTRLRSERSVSIRKNILWTQGSL